MVDPRTDDLIRRSREARARAALAYGDFIARTRGVTYDVVPTGSESFRVSVMAPRALDAIVVADFASSGTAEAFVRQMREIDAQGIRSLAIRRPDRGDGGHGADDLIRRSRETRLAAAKATSDALETERKGRRDRGPSALLHEASYGWRDTQLGAPFGLRRRGTDR